MIKDFINPFFQAINNNFEIFLIIFIVLILTLLLSLALAKFRVLVFLGYLPEILKAILLKIVILGQFALLIGLMGVYWINYQVAAELIKIPDNVLVSTDWVSLKIPIYFIEKNQLHRINANGSNHRIVFKAETPLKEYIFSPDGRYLVIVSEKDVFLHDQETQNTEKVDTIGNIIGSEDDLNGVIRGVRWAKDSQKFCYEIHRWSKYSSQSNLYVFDLKDDIRKSVISPGRKISSVYWSRSSDSLYYIYNEALDTSVRGYPFEVKVYRIDLVEMKPKLVTAFPYQEATVPTDSLALRDIQLYLDNHKYEFGRAVKENALMSAEGPSVGIDQNDHLFYVRHRWFRKRLFKIARYKVDYIDSEYQKKGGELMIQHISWLPGGRYIIMEHKTIGILILEPQTKRIGRLYKSQGYAFGWYKA